MKKLLLVLFAVTLLAACSKEEAPSFVNEDGIVLNNNVQELNQRLTLINEPLNLKGLKSTPTFTLVADAASPIVNGVKLSASYVHRRYQKVYVTYNERGNGYGGAIVVFDISDPYNPSIVSQMTFEKIDINACDINAGGSVLYLAGAHKAKGAVVLKIAIDGDGIITSTPEQVQTLKVGNAASANGIIQASDWIYVSAGNTNGGLFVYNRTTLAYVDSDLYNGAKFSTANGRVNGKKHISLEVDGSNDAYLHVYTVGIGDPSTELIWPVGQVSHQNVEPEFTNFGKATIFIRPNETTCYISMGMNGMKALNITNGDLVYTSPAGMITYGNTNGVSADSKYIYMANGAQGLYIAKAPTSGTEVEIVGIWDDANYPGSCNHVYSDNSYIFVAKGVEGGLKIIKED
ncbi:MAG: hypothetical protein PWR20_2048 [Bacteroidales bacterium]|jgi:hypothetical protein|nr:hypothetical protein [Bacteroidales bacterium]MDN5329793.1 hypothetical protein [Bacteroidales bacterium]